MTDNPALPGEAVLDAGGDSSLASRLRAHAQKLAVDTQRFDLPGWRGEIVIEARRLNRRDSQLVEQAQGVRAALLLTIAISTVSIIVRDGENEQVFSSWVEFGQALMEAPDGTTASEVVESVLPADQLATQLVEEIGAWARGRSEQELDELGE